MEIMKRTTDRGFDIIEFKDWYNHSCSIQRSSSQTIDSNEEKETIWFGINDAEPIILASKIIKGGTGWASYPIPDDVFIPTRMHLTREQVKELIPILQKFVDEGEI